MSFLRRGFCSRVLQHMTQESIWSEDGLERVSALRCSFCKKDH